MKRKLACLMALVLVFMLGNSALAVEQPGEDFYYLDTANVLSTEAEGTIYFCNQLLEEACGGQIVVAALDNLDGADTYDYAYELFNEWGIGSAGENNGFLLLLAIQEDDYYALAGSGVEGIFSSSELKNMFDEYLEPDFAKKDYEAGALKFFEAVLDKYIDRYNLDSSISFESGELLAQGHLMQGSTSDSFGGASSGGGSHGSAYGMTDQGGHYDYYYEEDDSLIEFVIVLIVIVLIIIFSGINSRRRGGSFWFFFGPPRHHHHHHHHGPHHPPRHDNRRPPRGPSGFGGGGFGGGAGRSGGFGGSFGGGRGGGGGSFGGGAGRGRH